MGRITGLTIEDFEQLPESLARNHELVDGELVDVSGNTGNHNSLRDALVELLRPHVRERKLGRVVSEQEFEFDQNAHGPDVSFIGPEKARVFDGARRVQPFVPDLAIEIASPNDKFSALVAKAHRYRQCGTHEAFIFCIETREVFVYSDHFTGILDENHDFRPQQIPGFSIKISDLFAMM